RFGYAVLAVCIATLKPSFGIPLVILMFAGRAKRVVVYGTTAAAALSVTAAAWMAPSLNGVWQLAQTARNSFSQWQRIGLNDAASGRLRVDAVGLISRIAGDNLGQTVDAVIAVSVLGVGALTLQRLSRSEDWRAHLLGTVVGCLTILACTYHQAYDLLMLALP